MLARLRPRTRNASARRLLLPPPRTAEIRRRPTFPSPRRHIPALEPSSYLRSDISLVDMPAPLLQACSSRCPSTITRATRPHPRTARKTLKCTILVSWSLPSLPAVVKCLCSLTFVFKIMAARPRAIKRSSWLYDFFGAVFSTRGD